MEGLGINLGYLIVQLISFIAIYLFLRAFAFGPITKGLSERRERIARGEENARLAQERLENAEAEAQKMLDEKRAEAQQIIADATRRADEAAAAVEAEAREEAQNIKDTARAEAESERNRVLSDLRGQIVSLSMAAAQKSIGDNLDGNKHKNLVNEFFSNLPDEAKGIGGQRAVVTTALPLTADEESKVKQQVGADDVEFKVDPSILGGAIVRSGDRMVDGSVRSRLGALVVHLQ